MADITFVAPRNLTELSQLTDTSVVLVDASGKALAKMSTETFKEIVKLGQIDSIPTEGSTNAVSSGGVKAALDEVEEALGEVETALGEKQDTLNFDDTPTAGSSNPVKSSGVRSAITDEATARQQADADLQEAVNEISNEVIPIVLMSRTSENMSDFVVGWHLPPTAKEFSQDTLEANSYLCYTYFLLPDDSGSIYAYSGYGDAYARESLFFLDKNNKVITRELMYKAGKTYSIPNGTVYVCVNFLKNSKPFGIIVNSFSESEKLILNEMTDYRNIVNSHEERTLRDFCYDQERRHPFEWKTFQKKWFAFMNDDARPDMGDYYNLCRSRRVPYCQSFILGKFANYSYTGNDANRKNLVKEPAIGENYTFTKESSLTYLRLYFDRRYSGGFPLVITVNETSYTINNAENSRISIGSGTDVTFSIDSCPNVNAGRISFLNVIATADSTDDVSSTVSWPVAEMLKNIVFDFGEILAHETAVIDMWDRYEQEVLFAKYIFDTPRQIDELLGEEHCKGAILPGGTNSDRGMRTELGQHYCCRYLLYSDFYGTSPQFSIQRVNYRSLVGSATTYAAVKQNALNWIANKGNGFYPLWTHSDTSVEKVSAVIDAILESENTICSNWRDAYDENS